MAVIRLTTAVIDFFRRGCLLQGNWYGLACRIAVFKVLGKFVSAITWLIIHPYPLDKKAGLGYNKVASENPFCPLLPSWGEFALFLYERGKEGHRRNYGDTVKIHYLGKLEDGTVFDSAVNRYPLQFTLGEGIV